MKLTRDLIGKQCPDCTYVLLTEADYRAGKRMAALLPVFKLLGLASDKPGSSFTFRSSQP